LKKGLFITFEGPEGCGKSTHAKLAAEELAARGFDVVLTREPGGTVVGEKLRAIILDAKNEQISKTTELLLFETARSQIVSEVILPALRRRKIVICDRFSDSTRAYQGYAGGMPLDKIESVDRIASNGVKPDLTLVMDIDAGTGLERAARKSVHDRMEKKGLSYHKKVRNGFLALARKEKKRIKVIKVRKNIDETFEAVYSEIARLLEKTLK